MRVRGEIMLLKVVFLFGFCGFQTRKPTNKPARQQQVVQSYNDCLKLPL